MTMNETSHKIGVTATAKFLDTFIIGTNAVESLGLAVNVWGDNFGPNGQHRKSYSHAGQGVSFPPLALVFYF